MSDSVRPNGRQPNRLPHPWDSPGKNTGVGCHFLLQRMKVKSESEVAQSCPTLSDPMDCSPPGSSAQFYAGGYIYLPEFLAIELLQTQVLILWQLAFSRPVRGVYSVFLVRQFYINVYCNVIRDINIPLTSAICYWLVAGCRSKCVPSTLKGMEFHTEL